MTNLESSTLTHTREAEKITIATASETICS